MTDDTKKNNEKSEDIKIKIEFSFDGHEGEDSLKRELEGAASDFIKFTDHFLDSIDETFQDVATMIKDKVKEKDSEQSNGQDKNNSQA